MGAGGGGGGGGGIYNCTGHTASAMTVIFYYSINQLNVILLDWFINPFHPSSRCKFWHSDKITS